MAKRPEDVLKERKEKIEAGDAAEEQWLPVGEQMPGIEASDDDEPEVVVGEEPEEEKPQVVTLSSEEFAALKAQGDSARAVKDGIEGLAAKLSYPQPQSQPVNAPEKTPEEFFAEHADDMFDPQKGAKLLREYNKMVSEQEFGPLINSLTSSLATTRKELLEAKEPFFKQYADEVEALVVAQPTAIRQQPDIYERAWKEVKVRHLDEIQEKKTEEAVEKAVEARLRELGIDPKRTVAGQRPAAYNNGEGRSSAQVSASSKRRVRLPDEKTRRDLERIALTRGVEMKDLLRAKGYDA